MTPSYSGASYSESDSDQKACVPAVWLLGHLGVYRFGVFTILLLDKMELEVN